MATFTSTACQTSASGFFINPPKYIENGVVVKSASYTFGQSVSAGDVVQMVAVPKGAHIIDVIAGIGIGNPASATLSLNIGDGNSTTRYAASGTAVGAGSGVLIRANNVAGLGYSYSAEDTIDAAFTAAGSQSGAVSIRLTVTYAMDQATDGSS